MKLRSLYFDYLPFVVLLMMQASLLFDEEIEHFDVRLILDLDYVFFDGEGDYFKEPRVL